MSAAGPTIVFVCLLVLLVFASIFYFSFIGRSFFAVLQQTSAGSREVIWPDEPIFDWITQGAQFLWLVAVWLCPVAMVLRAANPDIFSENPGQFVWLSGLTLWVLFPIGALSALSSGSRWIVLNPKLVIALARIAPVTLAFYVVSSVPLALALAAWYGAARVSMAYAPLAGALAAAALLIYARLLGRLAWKLNHTTTGRPRKREKAQEAHKVAVEVSDSWGPPAKRKKKKKRPTKTDSSDESAPVPLAAPEVERVYGVADDEPPQPEEDPSSYGVAEDVPARRSAYDALEPEATPHSKPDVTAPTIVPDDLESLLVPEHDPDKPPPLLLLSGVFEFPWLDKSARHWLNLTILGTIVSGVLHMVMEYLP